MVTVYLSLYNANQITYPLTLSFLKINHPANNRTLSIEWIDDDVFPDRISLLIFPNWRAPFHREFFLPPDPFVMSQPICSDSEWTVSLICLVGCLRFLPLSRRDHAASHIGASTVKSQRRSPIFKRERYFASPEFWIGTKAATATPDPSTL